MITYDNNYSWIDRNIPAIYGVAHDGYFIRLGHYQMLRLLVKKTGTSGIGYFFPLKL